MKNFFNNPAFFVIATLFQIGLGIIALLFDFIPVPETKGTILFWSSYCIIVAFMIYFLFVKLIEIIKNPKNKFKRFEDIKDNEIKYGYVIYKPFFWNEITHKGIGYKVLEEILKPFNVNMTEQKNYHFSNWSRIFKELENGKFDIIIIPLFETRRRLNKYNVTFCTPLFYSDIGIYAKKNKNLPNEKFLFAEAIEYIKNRNWKGKHLKREISHSLMEKHKLSSTEIKPTVAEFAEDAYFQSIINEINTEKTDFTFMEVFKAKTIIKDQNVPVINILKDKELLYPVSFVVRKEDTVLKNFINLRIIEMAMEQVTDSDGKEISKLKQIIKEVAAESGIEAKDFNDIFVWKKDWNL